MFRIDKDGAVANLPAPAALGSPGYFTEGNPATGTPATQVTADWLNAVQEELVNVVLAAGLALDKADRAQLLAAVKTLVLNTRPALATLVDAPVIAWDAAPDQVAPYTTGPFAQVTLAGNRTLALPTNLVAGTYILIVKQDATGSRTLSYAAGYKWPNNGVAPVLSTAPNAVDILTFVSDGVSMFGVAQKRFA